MRRRLRELRARTAAELRSQIEELLEVEVKVCVCVCVCVCVLVRDHSVCPIQSSRAKLNINVDITAPQFIVPQSLSDPKASVVSVHVHTHTHARTHTHTHTHARAHAHTHTHTHTCP